MKKTAVENKKEKLYNTPGYRLLLENLLTELKSENIKERNLTLFFKETQRLLESGEIVMDDINQMISENILKTPDVIELSTYLQKNEKTGLTFNEAREYAQRYHQLLLDSLIDEYKPSKAPHDKLEITFRKYEKKIADIFQNNITKDKLNFLKSLPEYHEKAYKKFMTSPFKCTFEELLEF